MNTPELPLASVRPYFSVVVLEGEDFGSLTEFLLTSGRGDVVARHESDGVLAFVRRREDPPTWAGPDAGFTDVTHQLTIALRRGGFIVVCTDRPGQERLQTWLDRQPALRRYPSEVLESALIRGEVKNLWLRGIHRRTSVKADGKVLSGSSVEQTLSPHEDGSYVAGSARAALPLRPDLLLLKGNAGTTPRNALVWLSQRADFETFTAMATELLDLLEDARAQGAERPDFLAMLASPADIAEVRDAFEVIVEDPDTLPAGALSDELRDLALSARDNPLPVTGFPDSAAFLLDGAEVTPELAGDKVRLDGDSPLLETDLVTVYYQSGHSYSRGRFWQARAPEYPFRNWRFEDFRGWDIRREKPRADSPQQIHDHIGSDTSLFDWVARHYAHGWLICDDGPGEVADFLHVSASRVLSLIHVKAAKSDSRDRDVSAAAYEVVVSQAVKNLIYISRGHLRPQLSRPPVRSPASWIDGQRVRGRREFLRQLDARVATDDMRVVILQPHVTQRTYETLRGPAGRGSPELMRLHLLESMLNSARQSCTGLNADLEVIAGKE
ncbi:hypothetical protein [Kutzneria buriramensis]|uniref:Uncharacterized protein n=1 Tax=Kutzneria buriramensis TaxID=1045776 RepID=A0A3E0H0L0_9PSEU|nr:hypothetical protein [Kutzneria buriramensis]REH35355.1 hypothetical protein BCF44_118216 [Kutzneria buriramensis]